MPRKPERLRPLSLYGVNPLDAMAALLRVPPLPKVVKPAKANRRAAKKKRAKG